MNDVNKAKQIVLQAAQKAFSAGLFAGTSGNLSMFIPEKNLVAITPSSIRYEGMTVEDSAVIDLAGNVVEGPHKPSSEHQMHTMIYAKRPNTGAIVHTHSPYATAFAVNQKPIPLILIEMIPFLGGEVPVANLELPGSAELGASVVQGMQGKNCCLMANHGVIAVGETMDQAYIRAEYIEDAAKICSIALGHGEIHCIPKELELRMKELS